ncbi:VWA domain-containing protein [Clostridium thermarum]|uniref:VWA domain-containing protein n=1 Tax=Clostridium thermarum TaxID=1716543 RepID=UPI00112338E5|nr:VWA domain-containing protein [Clostridium thermarum]
MKFKKNRIIIFIVLAAISLLYVGCGKKDISTHIASVSEPIYVDFKTIDDDSNILDLMFVVDTTGSMQDELDYLKAELKNVIRRVDAEASQSLDIRLSCNYYRDQGDEYVVRPFPFTRDIDEVINDMNKQYADGGGDTIFEDFS